MKEGRLDIKTLFLSFKRRIRVRLLTYFLLVSILPILLVGFIPYAKSQETVEKQVLELAQSVVNQLNGNISYYFKEMDLISRVIYYQLALLEKERALNREELNQFLLELKNNRTFIQDIHVLTEDETISTMVRINRQKLEAMDWYADALSRSDEKTWIGPHTVNYSENQTIDAGAVSLMYPFLHEGKQRVILIEMKQKELDTLFARPDLKNLGTLFLIDKFGKVIYSTDHTIVDGRSEQYISNTSLFEQLNENHRLIYDINFLSGWKISALLSEKQMNQSFHSIKKIVFILLGLFLLISIVLAFILSHRFIEPLRRLQKDIRQVEKGDFNIRTKIDSIDEIGDLSKSFNRMVAEIEALIQEMSMNEKKKKQIEMQSLQYQINPHFLYNTLNAVQWIAKLHKVPDISEMLTNLIKLLRTSLDSDNHLHTLEEELEVLNFYLKIQKHRYPDSFSIEYLLENRFLSVYVPRFTLQPLVENIFFHAFTDGKGTIQIEAFQEEEMIKIAVKDNGRGMSTKTLKHLLTKNEVNKKKTSSGIGILNVDDKIKLYFGSQYGLEIVSEEGIGTIVYIRLPITLEKGEGDQHAQRSISGG